MALPISAADGPETWPLSAEEHPLPQRSHPCHRGPVIKDASQQVSHVVSMTGAALPHGDCICSSESPSSAEVLNGDGLQAEPAKDYLGP